MLGPLSTHGSALQRSCAAVHGILSRSWGTGSGPSDVSMNDTAGGGVYLRVSAFSPCRLTFFSCVGGVFSGLCLEHSYLRARSRRAGDAEAHANEAVADMHQALPLTTCTPSFSGGDLCSANEQTQSCHACTRHVEGGDECLPARVNER